MRLVERVCGVAFGSVLAGALLACGEPLAALPDDTVAAVYFEDFGDGQGGYASVRLDNGACLQLADGTAFRFGGVPADDVIVGGRGNNPLAAYLAVGCEAPSASWYQLPSLPDPPFVFEAVSGDTTLTIELDERRQVTRCDFPACVSEAPLRGEAP